MGSRSEKNALFEAIALMGKAFASPVRLELLDLLAQAPRTVDELARAGGQSTANTSQHLQALHAAGMVTRARERTSVRYGAFDVAIHLPASSPAWLYAVNQGLHISVGLVAIPLLLAKLWSVIPRLFAWPPARGFGHLVERVSLLLLVGGSLF